MNQHILDLPTIIPKIFPYTPSQVSASYVTSSHKSTYSGLVDTTSWKLKVEQCFQPAKIISFQMGSHPQLKLVWFPFFSRTHLHRSEHHFQPATKISIFSRSEDMPATTEHTLESSSFEHSPKYSVLTFLLFYRFMSRPSKR